MHSSSKDREGRKKGKEPACDLEGDCPHHDEFMSLSYVRHVDG